MKTPDNKNLPIYDAKDFGYCDGTFAIEASALTDQRIFKRVWEDSCDVGFWMKGKNQSVLFTLVDSEVDTDGEVLCWTFESYDQKYTAKIFND